MIDKQNIELEIFVTWSSEFWKEIEKQKDKIKNKKYEQ